MAIRDLWFGDTIAVLKDGWMWGSIIWFFTSLLFLSLLFMLYYIYSVIQYGHNEPQWKEKGFPTSYHGSSVPNQTEKHRGSNDLISQKIDLTDPGFLRMLELEYATKYLQHIKI